MLLGQAPRILAVGDVRLYAPARAQAEVKSFYWEFLGLDWASEPVGTDEIAFRAHPRSGPRLIVKIVDHPPAPTLRRAVQIQVASLADCRERLLENGFLFDGSRGWSFYDRRLTVLDPGENRVELVAVHSF